MSAQLAETTAKLASVTADRERQIAELEAKCDAATEQAKRLQEYLEGTLEKPSF